MGQGLRLVNTECGVSQEGETVLSEFPASCSAWCDPMRRAISTIRWSPLPTSRTLRGQVEKISVGSPVVEILTASSEGGFRSRE